MKVIPIEAGYRLGAEPSDYPLEPGNCHNCAHMKGALHWWCTNDHAKQERRTSTPDGRVECRWWAGAKPAEER